MIKLQKQTFRLMNKSTIISKVEISDHESTEKALEHAKMLLLDHCKAKKLFNNEYRYMIDSKGSFLEVKCGNKAILCDSEAKDLVEKYNWNLNKKFMVLAKESNKLIEF